VASCPLLLTKTLNTLRTLTIRQF